MSDLDLLTIVVLVFSFVFGYVVIRWIWTDLNKIKEADMAVTKIDFPRRKLSDAVITLTQAGVQIVLTRAQADSLAAVLNSQHKLQKGI